MGKQRFDRVRLNQLLKEGKNISQIAEKFGVTPGAVSRAAKELNLNVVKSVALESAHRVVEYNLDAAAQLKAINDRTHGIINELSKSSDRADKQIILKACQEIRGQLTLQLEIFRTMIDVDAVRSFQLEVLEAIGEAAPDVRDKIIQNLKAHRALRSAAQITG